MNSIFIVIAALLTGISQQPWGYGFLCWFSLFPIIYVFDTDLKYKESFKYSFLFGFIYHLSFMYWLSGNIGIDSILLKYFTAILVSLFLGLNHIIIFTTLTFVKKYFTNSYKIYLLPFIFVSIEYLRSFGLYGFTWNSLSYSQTDFLVPSQIIEYTGIYGLTFWVVTLNVIIYDIYNSFSKNKIYFLLVIFISPWIIGAFIKSNIPSSDSTLRTKIIQPNVHLSDRRQNINRSLDTLIHLSTTTSNDSIDLIIWPETSISSLFSINGKYNYNKSKKMNQFLSDDINLVSGIESRNDNERYNSSILFYGDSIAYIYNKQRLVPNVEYTPKIFDKIGYNLGVANFGIGTERTMFDVNEIKFSSMVCLESIFPNPTRLFVKEGASFLVYVVNDGWYTTAPEPQQHAKRCIYRAIENRRYVLRSANTGISMVVNQNGNIVDYLQLNKSGIITSNIEIISIKTFYTKYGDVFSILNLIILLIITIFNFRKHKLING